MEKLVSCQVSARKYINKYIGKNPTQLFYVNEKYILLIKKSNKMPPLRPPKTLFDLGEIKIKFSYFLSEDLVLFSLFFYFTTHLQHVKELQ